MVCKKCGKNLASIHRVERVLVHYSDSYEAISTGDTVDAEGFVAHCAGCGERFDVPGPDEPG